MEQVETDALAAKEFIKTFVKKPEHCNSFLSLLPEEEEEQLFQKMKDGVIALNLPTLSEISKDPHNSSYRAHIVWLRQSDVSGAFTASSRVQVLGVKPSLLMTSLYKETEGTKPHLFSEEDWKKTHIWSAWGEGVKEGWFRKEQEILESELLPNSSHEPD
jgi:hypothetical protein